jgi:hypothetical protein
VTYSIVALYRGYRTAVPLEKQREESVTKNIHKSKSADDSTEKATEQGIRNIVGDQIYTVWLDMLHYMVPHGRTHRLSVLVASFLQYAAFLASNKWGNKEPPKGSADAILLEAWQGGDPDEAEEELSKLAAQIFRDAKVGYQRVNSRKQKYSIAEEAVIEFLRWEDMPWE